MVISVFKYPHDDFLVGIHLDFYVVTVEMVNGNDCVCQCPVQVLVFVLCPVISDCAVRWIVLIVQSVDEQNCTFLGQEEGFLGWGYYDTREQISRRNLFPDVIFYEYDNI